VIEVTGMAIPTTANNQIIDSLTQAYTAGGEETLSIVLDLVAEIAKGIDGAKQGQTSIEDLSVALENAEGALHEIVAKLAIGKG
jgi:hypothetical protein